MKKENSPILGIELPVRWRRVDVRDASVFLLQVRAIEALGTVSRVFVFGRVGVWTVEEMAAGDVEIGTDGGGDGNQPLATGQLIVSQT